MRKILTGIIVMAVVLVAGTSLMAGEEAKWLDPAGCYFCEPLAENAQLLENLTWEHRKINSGNLAVTTFTPEWEEAYQKAHAGMMARWESFDPTQEVSMCGMCQAWMKVPMDKLTFETIDFTGGTIGMTTSDDAEVVKQLHALTDRTIEEYAAMMKEMEGMKTGHEGHGH